jgi:hypothetical protein
MVSSTEPTSEQAKLASKSTTNTVNNICFRFIFFSFYRQAVRQASSSLFFPEEIEVHLVGLGTKVMGL